jgi:hypothetical protein
MSDFKFPCPKCGQHILCDTSNAGMQIPCPVCQTLLTVPTPPPAAPAAPGKLSINKTARHAPPPPPGAANAPAQPAWGTKPAPRPAAKKKFPVKMVSTIGVVIVILAVGWFGFGAPYLKQRAEEEKKKQEEAERQAVEQQKAAAAAAAKLKASKATWNIDLANAEFPERHASGRLHSADFTVETVIFQNGSLILRQDTGFSRQFVIGIPLKPGETIPGKSFQVTATDSNSQPRIVMNWKDETGKPPGTQSFTKGYAMKLEFGAAADGKVPGKIYLCVPDAEQSYVAGNFEIGPKTQAAAASGAPPDAARPRRAKREPPQ